MPRKYKSRMKKAVSLAPMPFGGDHGPNTAAAKADTIIEPVADENGKNPNHMGRRRRVEVIDTIDLTMRQRQAALAIRDAYCRVEMLSSGSPLAERVQSSAKPDAAIGAQVTAQSRWVHVTRPILRGDRALVEHVCCANRPIRASHERRSLDRLRMSLDRVADWLRY